MRTHRVTLLTTVSGLIAFLLLTACAPNRIYRDEFKSCIVTAMQTCDASSLQRFNSGKENEYTLGFIEIDDQGQLRNRGQLEALQRSFYAVSPDDSLLLVVFVHGWHHDARPGDPNIESFKENLARISAIESKRGTPEHPARKVAGVYVGWRGESIDLPPFNYLTFWDRKNTAQDVGYLGVTELLVKMDEVVNERNSVEPKSKNRLVIIGHSFGGAVVYSATSQILANRFVDSRPGKGYVSAAKGFGDLVVLLNPAFEALRYSPFYDLAQANCSFPFDQVPRLAILTSEADDATGILFPLGRVFSTFFETHNTVTRDECKFHLELDEGEADRNTVGHYDRLISHTLTPLDKEKNLRIATYENMLNIWTEQHSGAATQFGDTVLTHLNRTNPRNPYLNIRVDEEIIADHNDVFNEKVMNFVRLLIRLSTDDRGESK